MENGNSDAFPVVVGIQINQRGLTKREYFAGLAMQGILANDKYSLATVPMTTDAVAMADALLLELEKK